MKDKNNYITLIFAGMLICGILLTHAFVSAERYDVGYRKLMLGFTREQVRQVYDKEFK